MSRTALNRSCYRSVVGPAQCHTVTNGDLPNKITSSFVMDSNSSEADGISRGVQRDEIRKVGFAMLAYSIVQIDEAHMSHRLGEDSTILAGLTWSFDDRSEFNFSPA